MSEFQDLLMRLQALPPDELSQVLGGAPEQAAKKVLSKRSGASCCGQKCAVDLDQQAIKRFR